MKKGKTSGTSGVISKTLLASGDVNIERMTNLFTKLLQRTKYQKTGIQVSLWTVLRFTAMEQNKEISEGWSY